MTWFLVVFFFLCNSSLPRGTQEDHEDPIILLFVSTKSVRLVSIFYPTPLHPREW